MEDGQLTSEEEVGKSMLKVVRGGMLIFVAIALSQLLGFFRQLSIIRLLSPEEYGLITLGMIVTEVFIIIATLGLNLGSQRYIAFFVGKGDERRTRGVIFSTNGILVISVTLITIAALLLASTLARFFDMEEMSGVIMWLALLIAPYVTIDILTSYFLGFHRAGPKAVFQRIFLSIASLVCIIAFLMVRKDLASALLAMGVSYIIVAVLVLFYSTRNFPIKLRGGERIPMARTMLVFSTPLFCNRRPRVSHLSSRYVDTGLLCVGGNGGHLQRRVYIFPISGGPTQCRGPNLHAYYIVDGGAGSA